MELKQVHHLIALAKTLNFTRAAELCHISQPAFSQSIKRLEDEVGGDLVLRRGRMLRLSALGEQLLHHFEALASAETKLKTAARRGTQGDRLEIRVRVETTACLGVAVAALEAFSAEFADFDLAFETIDPARDVDSAPLDGVCLHLSELEHENAPPPQHKWIGQEPFVLIAGQGHPIAHKPDVTFEEVLHQDIIAWQGCPLEASLRAAAESRGIDFTPKMRVDDFFVAQTLVSAGLGVATAPQRLVAEGAVQTISITELCLFTPIIVRGRTSAPNEASRVALEALLNRLPSGGMWRPISAP